jgi:hypothetical protein
MNVVFFKPSLFTCFGRSNHLQKNIVNTHGNYNHSVIGHCQYLQKLLIQGHRYKILFCNYYYDMNDFVIIIYKCFKVMHIVVIVAE